MDSKVITERLRGVIAGYFIILTFRQMAGLVGGARSFLPPHPVQLIILSVILSVLAACIYFVATGFIACAVFFRTRYSLVFAICYECLTLIFLLSTAVFSKPSTVRDGIFSSQLAVDYLTVLSVIAASLWLLKRDREGRQL